MTDLSVSDNSLITLPLRNLVAIAFGLVVASTAYVTMNQEITQHGHELLMQQAEIVTGSSLRDDSDETIDTEVWPEGSLEVLSQVEAEQLRYQGENFRR